MNHPLFRLLFGIVLIGALALSSCAGRKQHGPPASHSEPIAADTARPGVVVQPPRTILDKLTGRTPAPVYYPPGTPVVVKGKKNTLTINHVAGNQSNQSNTAGKNAAAGTGATAGGKADGPVAGAGGTLTNIEKPKAPTNTGANGVAQDFTKQGQRGGAAASGPGAIATATTIKPPTPWLKYGLWALGALGGYWILFGGGGAVLLALWRRNKPTENQA